MRLWMIALVLVLAMGSVEAATVQRIAMENCGFTGTTSSLTCSDTFIVSCDVTDTTGASAINEVSFTIGGTEYNAALTSGSSLNGTWSTTFTFSSEVPQSGLLQVVQAKNSAGNTCASGSEYNDVACFINFTSAVNYDGSCTCTYAQSSVCGVDNVKTTTFIPTAGCPASYEAYTTTGTCDYCDPGWELSSFTCEVNRTAEDPFRGTASAEFTASNPSCCATTSLSSDCSPPAGDGNQFVCQQGYFLGDYNDVTASRKNAGTKLLLDDTTTTTETLSSLALSGGGLTSGRQLQPVVFDIDNDGTVEIVTFTNPTSLAGVITVYDDALSVEQTISLSRTIIGDPGLFHFDARNGLSGSYKAGTNGAGIAIITQTGGGVNYMSMYEYTSGSLTLKNDVLMESHDSINGGGAQSVLCDRDICATVIYSNTFATVTTGGTLTKMELVGSTGDSNSDWKNIPVFTDVDARTWVAKGSDAGGNVLIYVCETDQSTCTNYVNTSMPVGNVSDVYVGEEKTCGGSACSPVYWTELRGNEAYASVSYINHATKSWQNTAQYNINYPSNDATCVTSPAAAECPEDGIAVTAQWGPGTDSVSDLLTLPIEFSATDSSSFIGLQGIQVSGGASSGEVAQAQCAEGSACYFVAGDATCAGSGCELYSHKNPIYEKNPNLVGWTPGPANPFLNEYYGSNVSSPFGGYSCNVSDGVIAYGYLGDKFVQIVSELKTIKGESTSGNGTHLQTQDICRNTVGGLWEWQGIYVYTYKTGEGWKLLASEPSVTWSSVPAYTGGSVLEVPRIEYALLFSPQSKRAICDGERCWFELISDADEHYVYEVDSAGADVYRKANNWDKFNIVGFAETSEAYYFSLHEPYYTSANNGPLNRVVRYDKDTPTTDVALYTATYVDALLGLTADLTEADVAYFAHIPGSMSSICLQTNTSAPGKYNDQIFVSDLEQITGDLSGSPVAYGTLNLAPAGDFRRYYQTCNHQIKKITNGVVATDFIEEVVKWQTKAFGNSVGGGPSGGMITSPEKRWSIGQFDSNGEYYATYVNGLCMPSGSNTCLTYAGQTASYIPGGQQYYVFERITPDGTYHPLKVRIPDDTITLTTRIGTDNAQNLEICTSLREELGGNSSGCAPLGYYTFFGDGEGWSGSGDRYQMWTDTQAGALFSNLDRFGGLLASSSYIRYVTSLSAVIIDYVGATASTNSFMSLACLTHSPGGSWSRRISGVIESSSCPARLVTADVDNDGVDEVFTKEGVYEFTGTPIKTANYPSATGLAVVDFTADTYLDLVAITGSAISTITSDFTLQASYGDNLAIGGLDCRYDDSTNTVTVTPYGITSPNPESLLYSARLYAGGFAPAGTLEESTIATADSTITFNPLTPTTYAVSYFVLQGGQSVAETCSIEATAPTIGNAGAVDLDASCTIAPGGEFNYYDSVKNYGWVSGSGGVLPSTDGERARFARQSFIGKEIGCSDKEMSVEIRYSANSLSDTAFEVYADYNNVPVKIGELQIKDGRLLGNTNQGKFPLFETSSSVADGTYKTLKMEFTRGQSLYTIFVDGEVIRLNNLVNNFNGEFTDVQIVHNGGVTNVDYIRTAGLSGQKGTIETEEEKARRTGQDLYLSNCAPRNEIRNFSQRGPGNYSYENMQAYCESQGGVCSISDLRSAVNRYPNCFQEAVQYCVEVSYADGEFGQDGSVNQEGFDGATVCTTALATTAVSDRIFISLWNVLWEIAVSNLLLTIFVIFVVVVSISLKTRSK